MSDSLIDLVKGFIRSMVSAVPAENNDIIGFFQFGLGMSAPEQSQPVMLISEPVTDCRSRLDWAKSAPSVERRFGVSERGCARRMSGR